MRAVLPLARCFQSVNGKYVLWDCFLCTCL